MNQRRRLYYDSTNEVFVVGNFRAIGAGKAILREPAAGYISVSIPGMGDPLGTIKITDIESDSTGTSYYSGLDGILNACSDLFIKSAGSGIRVAWASDDSGSDWSLTPSTFLKYRAEISWSRLTDPEESDFASVTWVKVVGEDATGTATVDSTLTKDSINAAQSGDVYSRLQDTNKRSTDILAPESVTNTSYDGSVTTNTTGTVQITTLTAGITYTIFSQTDNDLSDYGLRFYDGDLNVIQDFEQESAYDYATGVTFTYTPEVDHILYFRTVHVGDVLNFLITYEEYKSERLDNIEAGANNINAILNTDNQIIGIFDTLINITTATGIYYCEKHAGKTVNVALTADYSDRFSIYGYYNDGTSEVLLDFPRTTDFTAGVTGSMTIPSNINYLAIRTYVSGVTITSLIISEVSVKANKNTVGAQFNGKNISFYGDSITAINNGDYTAPYSDFTIWGNIAADAVGFSAMYGRGIGSQKYSFDSNGGSVAFIDADGNLNSRNDSYNYDNYEGNVTVPDGTTPVRGTYCSWLRITTMYPESMKDDIHVLVIKGSTNDDIDATAAAWVDSDTTDPEWAASDYYADYGGDFNIATLKGGMASTIMKFQAWMPNALIIIATPLSGRGTTIGEKDFVFPKDEYYKSQYVKEVAEMLSIPVIDVNAECGINGWNREIFIEDTVHPYTLEGNRMLGKTIAAGLLRFYPVIRTY